MEKEKLTVYDIIEDLQREMREAYKQIAFFSVLFLLAFVPTFISLRISLFLIIRYFALIVADIFLVFIIIRRIKKLVMINNCLGISDRIVKDKLISREFKERYSRTTVSERYRLHFSQYGNYFLPSENYTWSSVFSMSDEGVFNLSDVGDEFYLVLSKRHTGEILYVYNAKMFDLEL